MNNGVKWHNKLCATGPVHDSPSMSENVNTEWGWDVKVFNQRDILTVSAKTNQNLGVTNHLGTYHASSLHLALKADFIPTAACVCACVCVCAHCTFLTSCHQVSYPEEGVRGKPLKAINLKPRSTAPSLLWHFHCPLFIFPFSSYCPQVSSIFLNGTLLNFNLNFSMPCALKPPPPQKKT